MIPKMIVVVGPPGSGKSTLYPVSSFGVSYFNADDRAAELNGGSYVSISNEIAAICCSVTGRDNLGEVLRFFSGWFLKLPPVSRTEYGGRSAQAGAL